MQGHTIKAPTAVVVDFKKFREPAQAYVSLSRAQRLSQIFILDQLYHSKWKVSQSALNELANCEEKAINFTCPKEVGEVLIVSLMFRTSWDLSQFAANSLKCRPMRSVHWRSQGQARLLG